ncbi:MAG: DUF1800 domain-containing protein [Sulfuriferula sp.]|nr:DUF1800 domain-containing protein [Sulfuriferula sp.]
MLRFWITTILLLSATLADAAGMGEADAWHLLARTGFAPTAAELSDYARLSHSAAVDQLLAQTVQQAITPVPAELAEYSPPPRFKDLSEEEKKQFQREQIQHGLQLRARWMQEMVATPSPLTEHMTLFWHNHFVSSIQKVKSPALMLAQNQLLRRDALGNFGDMLHAVAKDPAMIIYLDNLQNRKAQPNENFAREVMELFTLGIGNYTEQDVREAARAFTGWSLDRDTGAFLNRPFQHDNGIKTVLGQTGNFNGDDVLDILLQQPATAEWVTQKLWRDLISDHPDPAEIKRLAAIFRDQHYEIRPLLRAILLSDAFWAPQNRGNLVKSPVELLVGSVRQLNIHQLDPRILALTSRQLEQDLFAPPNVKGWPGGDSWINSTTLLNRKQFLDKLTRGADMPLPEQNMIQPPATPEQRLARLTQRGMNHIDYAPDNWIGNLAAQPQDQYRRAEHLLLAAAPSEPVAPGLPPADYVRTLLLDPVYQLK